MRGLTTPSDSNVFLPDMFETEQHRGNLLTRHWYLLARLHVVVFTGALFILYKMCVA